MANQAIHDRIGVLLGAADPSLVPRLLARSSGARAALSTATGVLSDDLVEAVLTVGDLESRLALIDNAAFVERHRDRALQLAATGDPRIGTALLQRHHRDDEVRAAVIETIDPADPGWRATDGLVSVVLASSKVSPQWAVAGHTPFSEIDRAYLRHGDSWRAQLQVVGNLWRRHGRAEAAGALADGRLHPIVAELVTAALAEPVDVPADGPNGSSSWDRQVAVLTTPQWSIRVLRASDYVLPDRWPAISDLHLDWPAVLAAHADQPFHKKVLPELVKRADCPEEFLIAVADRDLLLSLPEDRVVSAAVIGAFAQCPREGGGTDTHLARLIRTSLERGTLTAAEALQVLKPLSTLRGVLEEDCGAALIDEVGERVHAALGTDPGAWQALWNRIFRWPHTLDELLAAAVQAAATTDRWAGADPVPLGPELWESQSLGATRAGLMRLIRAMPLPRQLDLLPVLPDFAVFDLFARRRSEPELFATLLAHGDRRSLRMLAANRFLTIEQTNQLLALGDPDVHAQLYFVRPSIVENRADWADYRRQVLTGARRLQTPDPSQSGVDVPEMTPPGDPFPLGDALRDYFFGSRRQWQTRAPLIDSGQADVAIELLRAVRIPTGLLQLRLVHAVAHRDGVPAAARVLGADLADRRYRAKPWDPTARRTAEDALASGESDGDALAALDAAVAEWSSPTRWIERLRRATKLTDADRATLEVERYAIDWPLLVKEHGDKPFAANVLHYLRFLPDCPLPPEGSADRWKALNEAVLAGTEQLSTVVAENAPAAELLTSGNRFDWWERPDNPLPKLCNTTLGDNVDAWQLAFDLLGDFPGTLPELLSTAAIAATSPPPTAG